MTDFIATEDPSAGGCCCCAPVEPAPVVEALAPAPVVEEPPPAPVVEEPPPAPVVAEPAPAPVIDEAAPAPVVEQAAVAAPEPAAPAPAVSEPAAVAEQRASAVMRPGQPGADAETGVVVSPSAPSEFAGLNVQTGSVSVETDYTPPEFADIGREVSPASLPAYDVVEARDGVVDPQASGWDPDFWTQFFASPRRNDGPVMPFYGPMSYGNTLGMIQAMGLNGSLLGPSGHTAVSTSTGLEWLEPGRYRT